MFLKLVFLIIYRLRNLAKNWRRRILYWYDCIISFFYPYVWRNVQLEFVPQHILLTGGLFPVNPQKRAQYIKRLADCVATGYDCALDLFTLHVPYSLWGYEDVSMFSAKLNESFQQLGYRAFISFVQKGVDDQLLVEHDEDSCQEVF